MATASSWKSSGGGHLHQSRGAIASSTGNKITKGRGRMVVKPILKKLQPGSEKNSLDLDRGWEEQPHNWGEYSSGRSARDVTFRKPAFSDASDGASIKGSGGVDSVRPIFQHARSPSGASHASVATSGSGTGPGRGGFVHPFQQTPRTATPPLLSYAGSMASFEAAGGAGRDYSPTITENDDDDDEYGYQAAKMHPYSLSQSSLRRPSLASQRTASFSDMHGVAQSNASLKNGRTGGNAGPGPANSRLVHAAAVGSSRSQSDLRLNITTSSPQVAAPDSTNTSPSLPPRSTTTPFPVLATNTTHSYITSPTSSLSAAPLSPLRTSLEMGLSGLAPRLRSLSEQESRARKPSVSDPVEHARLMREARAKFDEKERLKAEKAARKQHKSSLHHQHHHHNHHHHHQKHQSKESEKRDLDMFRKQKSDASLYVSNTNNAARPGTASGTAVLSHRISPSRSQYSVDQTPHTAMSEKPASVANAKKQSSFSKTTSPKDRKSAKNAWTNFVLWIRTTILKLKRGD